MFCSLAYVRGPTGAHLLKVCCWQEVFKLILLQRTQTKDKSPSRESVVMHFMSMEESYCRHSQSSYETHFYFQSLLIIEILYACYLSLYVRTMSHYHNKPICASNL